MTETLLKEFEFDVESWTLIPSDGGRFEVEVNGKLVYSKLATKRHTDADEIRALLQEELAALNP
ncbi:MAG: hypothetical protein Kow00124_21290 [Anaerolineae bacterium]